MRKLIITFSSLMRLLAAAVAILLMFLVRGSDSPAAAFTSLRESAKKLLPQRFLTVPSKSTFSEAQAQPASLADGTADADGESQSDPVAIKASAFSFQSSAEPQTKSVALPSSPEIERGDSRMELEQRTAAVSRYAESQVARLSHRLNLRSEQEDRLFAVFAMRSPAFDPQMRIQVNGVDAAQQNKVSAIESLEKAVAAELDPDQREAHADHLLDQKKWWRDVFGKLSRNARLTGSIADADAGDDKVNTEGEVVVEISTETEKSGRGRSNQLIED